MDKFKLADYKTMDVMADYLQGKDMKGREVGVGASIVEALKSSNPHVSDNDIQSKLTDLCVQSRT